MSAQPISSATGAGSGLALTDWSPYTLTYSHVVTRGDRLRHWSNLVAEHVASLMERGADEKDFIDFAEWADELARVAEFIEPEPLCTVTVWGNYPARSPETGGGSP